jgi:selenide,water dikinase
MPRILLLGAGHAHVEVLRRFAATKLPGARITLVTADPDTPYSGMLPGQVAGHYAFEETHIDVGKLARAAGATLVLARITGFDATRMRVALHGRPELEADLLSVNLGITPDLAVPGAAEHAIPVKPIAGLLPRLAGLLASRIAVVGAGAGGTELALALRQRHPDAQLFLVGPTLLPGFAEAARRRIRAALARHGVAHVAARVARVEPGLLHLENGSTLAAEALLWTTGAAAAAMLAASGAATNAQGFLRVTATLASPSHPRLFAAGDCAALDGAPRPKAGVWAVRAGPVLAENLRRAALGQPGRAWRPQRTALAILATGPKHAVAVRGHFAAQGAWAWRWKDRIDRAFMARFRPMPMPPETAMQCAGCAAKLPAHVLDTVVRELTGAPEDAATVLGAVLGGTALASVDMLRAFVSDPYRFGELAARHALNDLFAMGAAPSEALAIAQLPPGTEEEQAETLRQLLAGARATLDRHGCALVGGHTALAPELALGFAVLGRAAESPLAKQGAQPGDALLLTGGLGTGLLLAAEMRLFARASWIEAAFDPPGQPCAAMLAVLRAHGVRALTDVSGFGLAGHLAEMLGGSLGAQLDLHTLPALTGALECAGRGYESSLAPANRRVPVAGLRGGPREALLFDPQTCGPLLAALPAAQAAACAAALPGAAVIGHITAACGIMLRRG